MGLSGELPSRDAGAVQRLRAILGDSAEPADRDELALYSTAVIRNHLLQRCVHLRFGFPDPFARVADDVAGMETALLLDPDRLPSLGRALRRRLGGTDPLDALERPLVLAFRGHLRMRGRQGLEREWMGRHRPEALLLRCLQVALPRIQGILLARDARGRFVTSPASDMTRPPIDREGLIPTIRACAPDFRPRTIGVALRDVLVPAGLHGGYCFLMDLVRAVHSVRAEIVTEDPEGTGATPASSGLEAERERERRLASQIRAFLLEEANRIDRRDLVKDRRKRDPLPAATSAEVRAARVSVAVEVLLQEIGLVDSFGETVSLTERLRLRIPEASRNGELRAHIHRTDYIVERLRRQLRRLGPVLFEPMWRRWWRWA